MTLPKICFVVNSVSETSVPATIATALVDYENLNVDILTWFEADSFEGDDRVDVIDLGGPQSTTGVDRETFEKACSVLREYDIIQANHNHAGSIAKLIGRLFGTPLVSREGNTRDGFTRQGRIANGLTNAFVDRIVPNSQAVYNSFTRWESLLIDEDQIRIIPNGVDLDRIDTAANDEYNLRQKFDIPSKSVLVGTASKITEQKAHDVLVEAIKIANIKSDTRIDLVIAGDGPRRSSIEALIHRLGIQSKIHFTGLVDRDTVYKILSEIDVYAMPSRWEGFSNAAVEALGAGNPCVFSDIDPFSIPYQDVALFHRVDDSNALAGTLVEFAEDPELRHQYGQRGRNLVDQKYTLRQIAAKYADLYRNIL